jgi:hypothetical protein
MVRTFLKVYMELGSYFLFLQEQIKDIIILHTFFKVYMELGSYFFSARTNKRHHDHRPPPPRSPPSSPRPALRGTCPSFSRACTGPPLPTPGLRCRPAAHAHVVRVCFLL